MSREEQEQSGLILYLSQQSLPVRLLAYIVFVLLVIGFIIGITIGLYYLNVSNFPRLQPYALAETVTVAEFVTFEDEAAYPAAVGVTDDGTIYTGSYAHGAVWRINSAGNITEIPGSREQIGSVIGLDVAGDESLYVLDHLDAFSTGGAKVWQITDDIITLRADFGIEDNLTLSKPNDIAVDSNGRVYLLDIALNQLVLLDGENTTIWWQAPDESYQIAGLAYNALNDSLLITDANRHAIYQIPVNANEAESARETIFMLNETLQEAPQFNGITVDGDGTAYVSAFALNEIWQIEPGTNDYTVLAINYRGSSDVAYDALNHRLFVNNWDQSWLIPVTLVLIQVDIPPRLPFSVDVITLAD